MIYAGGELCELCIRTKRRVDCLDRFCVGVVVEECGRWWEFCVTNDQLFFVFIDWRDKNMDDVVVVVFVVCGSVFFSFFFSLKR